MSKRDYYEVLGVVRTCNEVELKAAYRKLAMQHHPDRNPGDTECEHKFKELNEAYDVLKDGDKRAAYDRFGHAAFEQGGMGGAAHGFGADFAHTFSDIFEDLFGMGGGRRGGGRGQGRERGSDLRYNMEIGLAEAFTGKTAQIRIPTSVTCEACSGTGAKAGSKPKQCATCGGAGKIRHAQGFFTLERTCPACQGRGQVIENPCPSCAGARRTGIFDHLAAALTGRAGALKREEALRMPDLAGAAAGRALLRLAAGLGAGAGAGFAGHRGRDADLRGLAGKSLCQADFHIVAQIRAALAALAPPAAAAAAAHAEQVFENVGECMGEIGAEAVRSPAHAALLEGGVTEAIIGGALVAVLEHVIGLVELFEFVLAFGVARIAIRMMLHGELAERGLELGVAAGARYAQDLVVVALGHAGPAVRSKRRHSRT